MRREDLKWLIGLACCNTALLVVAFWSPGVETFAQKSARAMKQKRLDALANRLDQMK